MIPSSYRLSLVPLGRAVRLGRWRLGQSITWKLARLLAVAVSTVFTISILFLAWTKTPSFLYLVPGRASLWLAWIVGTLLAFWASADHDRLAQRDGITDWAAGLGLDQNQIRTGQWVASAWMTTRLVFLSLLPVVFASCVSVTTLGGWLGRGVMLAVLGAQSLLIGLVTGGLAGACGWLSPRHGRALVSAVILGPWLIDRLILARSSGFTSIPGIVAAVAEFAAVGGGT